MTRRGIFARREDPLDCGRCARSVRTGPRSAEPESRRHRWFAGMLLLLAALAASRCVKTTPEPPNVLLLVMDTTRADRCSVTGYDRPTTPRLAEIARESVVFTDAWSPASWTFPAHAALFTGRTPEDLGVVRSWPALLGKQAPVLAEILGGAGWATGCFSNNAWLAPHSGLSRGFDVLDQVHLGPLGASAREAHQRALAWMAARQREGRRFFAFVNDIEPHAPWNPPKEFEERFLRPGTLPEDRTEARELRYPKTMISFVNGTPFREGLRRAASDLYDAEVFQLDSEIGTLFDGMRACGLLDRTIVVIAGDHGEGLGDHGAMEHGTLLHRELLHVPLLVRPPGGCAARVNSDVVRLHDAFPTILEACGVALPGAIDGMGGIDGRSLLGPTAGRKVIAAERTRLDICEATDKALGPEKGAMLRLGRRALYDGRYHLIVDEAGGVELYEPRADPGERENLATARPEVVTSLRAELDASKPR